MWQPITTFQTPAIDHLHWKLGLPSRHHDSQIVCHTWNRSVGSTCPFSSVAEPGTDHQPSFSQLLKLGICCRSLVHFIEASKNLPQPVQVLRLRNRYSIRSLSVQISKDFCHRKVVDVTPGLIGDVGAFACANFRENLCFCQLEKSGAN